jgi:hypothetical protein
MIVLNSNLHDKEIINQARKIVKEQGWVWKEPVGVDYDDDVEDTPVWVIYTNALSRGGNIIIRLRQSDLEVVKINYVRH